MENLKTDRWVIHSDVNGFYAAVECLERPDIRALPVAICGDIELRHGVVIAANPIAKRRGVKVGQSNGEALAICPGLVIINPRMEIYDKYSLWTLELYAEYSDFVQSYGKDEAWVDITNMVRDKQDARQITDEIRRRMREQFGLTCSIGVSFNKTISKLASDMKKVDATTVITRETFKDIVWKLPPDKLLGISSGINKILHAIGITDIGNIAKAPVELFIDIFGKLGEYIHRYAGGEENSPVTHKDYVEEPTTIGNIETTYRDMKTLDDVRRVIYMLSESVASRLREQHYKCRTVQVYIRDNNLKSCERQATFEKPSFIANTIAEMAMKIFQTKYNFAKPLRSIGVRACNLVPDTISIQSSLFDDPVWDEKLVKVAITMDILRNMYGYNVVQRGIIMEDKKLTYIPAAYNRSNYRVGSAYLNG